eukprot:1157930-Pelagomonas_calceolata.AAC.6
MQQTWAQQPHMQSVTAFAWWKRGTGLLLAAEHSTSSSRPLQRGNLRDDAHVMPLRDDGVHVQVGHKKAHLRQMHCRASFWIFMLLRDVGIHVEVGHKGA